MDRALQFYRRTLFNRTYSPSSSDSPATIARQFAFWQKQISSFETTFQPILDGAIQSDGSVSNAAALVISLHQKSVSILLASVPRDSEMVFDSFLPDFHYIVRTSALLIASRKETHLPRNPRFSLEIGIIPPLHLVATKCRDPVTRREAVDLMWTNPRQEGWWDSLIFARAGLWIINSEEEGLPPPQLPARSSNMSGLWSHSVEQYSPLTTPLDGDSIYPGYFEGGQPFMNAVRHETAGVGGSGAGEWSQPTWEQNIPRRNKSKGQGSVNSGKGWIVPEGNRVKLTDTSGFIPERYISVKVHKALPRRDGTREERETIIAW